MMLALLLAAAACPEGAEQTCMQLEQRTVQPPDRATLERLLQEPEFSRVRNRNQNVIAVLWEQFFAWLKKIFQTDEAATFAKTVPFAVLALAFTIALAAVLRFVRVRGGGDEQRAHATAPAHALVLKPAPEHLANARALLATSPRDAIREALLALLSSLERRNLARPDRVKTNRELCAELPGRGADAALVRAVAERVDWYDRAFYSLAPIAKDEAAGFLASVEQLV